MGSSRTGQRARKSARIWAVDVRCCCVYVRVTRKSELHISIKCKYWSEMLLFVVIGVWWARGLRGAERRAAVADFLGLFWAQPSSCAVLYTCQYNCDMIVYQKPRKRHDKINNIWQFIGWSLRARVAALSMFISMFVVTRRCSSSAQSHRHRCLLAIFGECVWKTRAFRSQPMPDRSTSTVYGVLMLAYCVCLNPFTVRSAEPSIIPFIVRTASHKARSDKQSNREQSKYRHENKLTVCPSKRHSLGAHGANNRLAAEFLGSQSIPGDSGASGV